MNGPPCPAELAATGPPARRSLHFIKPRSARRPPTRAGWPVTSDRRAPIWVRSGSRFDRVPRIGPNGAAGRRFCVWRGVMRTIEALIERVHHEATRAAFPIDEEVYRRAG